MRSFKIVVLSLSLLCFSFQAGIANAGEQDIKTVNSTNSENTFPVKTPQPRSLDKLYGGLKRGSSKVKPPKGYVALPKDHTGACSTACTHRRYVTLKKPSKKQLSVTSLPKK